MAALSLAIFGSGSSGNAAALSIEARGTRRTLLIDLGLSRRRVLAGLTEIGVGAGEIAAVLLTHLDHDHFAPTWGPTLAAMGVPLFVHERHRTAALARGVPPRSIRPFTSAFEPIPGIVADPILTAHDEHGTVAFHLTTPAGRVGWATDLGRAEPELVERFAGVRLLAIESNYCPRMQAASDRPEFLKRRIVSGRGHLSNEEAIDTVQRIAAIGGAPERILLLHLSRQCNCPEHLRGLAGVRLPDLAKRIVIAAADRTTGPVRLGGIADRLVEQRSLFEAVAAEPSPDSLASAGDRRR